MRILIISPIFRPLADAEANCSGKFVQGLIDQGIEASVIFSSNVRTPKRLDASRMWEPIQRISTDVPSCSGVSVFRRCWLGLKYQSTAWSHWTHSVVTSARALHRHSPFDLVVSRSLPNHAHLAGYWVSSA